MDTSVIYTVYGGHWSADSLDFGEDDVHVGAGHVLAVGDLAVFAQFGPVLPVQLLPRRLRVAVNRKLLEGRQELLQVRAVRHDGRVLQREDHSSETKCV